MDRRRIYATAAPLLLLLLLLSSPTLSDGGFLRPRVDSARRSRQCAMPRRAVRRDTHLIVMSETFASPPVAPRDLASIKSDCRV